MPRTVSGIPDHHCRYASATLALAISLVVGTTHATGAISPAADSLKRLSVEELMDIEVTSVSRRPEKLSQTASAIQVISQEDIRRSGATSIPEALRLAPNLQVAQVNSSQWAVSARGFNNVLANKLLVMVDGRTVYTPFYAGVFWDAQDTVLEDIDRIEVVSGPGGTLWGANAINGVINIMTKAAAQTQGLFVEADAGTELTGLVSMRYGGELSPDLHYRVYGKTFERDATVLADGGDPNDDWRMNQGGFRLDWGPQDNLVTVQSDFYSGRPNPDGTTAVQTSGGNLLGRWEHTLGAGSDLRVQMYYDRTKRDFANGLSEELATYDLDGQHRFQIGGRQEVVWGFGVRRMDDQVDNLPLFAFLPAHRILSLYSVFVQDEIALVPDRLRLTLGGKLEHNDYTGFEHQPNVRLAWSPTPQQTLWTAISRAARTPARIDRDFYLYLTPTLPLIAGGDFDSEKLLAYEAGWRLQPDTDLSLSLSTFYNDYEDLRSAEPGPPPFGIPITFANGVKGHSYGVELAAMYQLNEWWRLRGGYTFLRKSLEVKAGSRDLNRARVESDDPQNQLMIQSLLNLPGNIELDGVVRYVDALPAPRVPSYISLDLRLAWELNDRFELSVVGQNLLDDSHPEFVPTSPSAREVERSVYGRIVWRN